MSLSPRMAATMNQSHQLRIKFTASSTCRCQRNFSWRRKWNLRAVAVTIRYPHNHTTQACRSDLNHLLDMTPIFSMHHVSRSIFFSTPHRHPTRSYTHTCSSYGLSDPSTSENEGMLHPWNSGAELELFVGVSWHRRTFLKISGKHCSSLFIHAWSWHQWLLQLAPHLIETSLVLQ